MLFYCSYGDNSEIASHYVFKVVTMNNELINLLLL